MSVRRQDFCVTFTVHAGTTKTLELTILDPDTGSAWEAQKVTVTVNYFRKCRELDRGN